jgi:DNA-directed RNA polymerase II subunit RPB4
MTSRSFPSRHKAQQEEEDAAALKLGPEFNNAGCLLISEVKYLLENRDKDAPDTVVYNKTLEYVKTFAKFNTTDSASAVREILRREPELTQFETAQIANLCPADAEEAKSIIPRCAIEAMWSHLPTVTYSSLHSVSLKSKMIDFRLYWTRFKLCGNSRHKTSWKLSVSLLTCQGPGTAL